jgi:hypothetical protein
MKKQKASDNREQLISSTTSTFNTRALRPRARIVRILGDELISSDIVAIIELVKNAYDAEATRVLVRFQGPFEIGQGVIEIIDNGHGMSLETIQTAWLEPATPLKKRKTYSENGLRRVLGEKGIGRFAASRLSDTLEIVTRRAGMQHEIRAIFNWEQFDEDKYLDEIVVPYQETETTEIRKGGTIELLWKDGELPPPGELNHGTILRMRHLRSVWDKKKFEEMRTNLSRLISPFAYEEFKSKNDQFQIYLDLPEPFLSLAGAVEPPEALRNPHYSLKGNVNENGCYDFTVKIRYNDKPEQVTGQFRFPDGHMPQCGPFNIELRIWDRDHQSLVELARKYGSSIKNVRADLDKAAGISIFRDGFRVLPYGEPKNDWLRLDLRSRLNPTLRLANNQIVGYVLISADRNPLLRDQSNREGLIEGPALDDLSELILLTLSEVEKRRYGARPRVSKSVRSGGLFTDFSLAGIHDFVKKHYPKENELIEALRDKEKDLEDRIKEVQEVLARYRRLATLGQLIDTVLHEGRAPLAKIINEVDLGLRDINRREADRESVIARLRQRFEKIRKQSDVMATVFNRIEPFGGRKRGRPATVYLEQVIADAFNVLDAEIRRNGARISLPKTKTLVTVDQSEIQEVIINLLQNSLYWLQHVPKECREINVMVRRNSEQEVEILFSDSGPGIDPRFRDYIFDPYFSTKPDGIGLGLTIAGEIIKEYYNGELELIDSGQLSGANFRITLRRRV